MVAKWNISCLLNNERWEVSLTMMARGEKNNKQGMLIYIGSHEKTNRLESVIEEEN